MLVYTPSPPLQPPRRRRFSLGNALWIFIILTVFGYGAHRLLASDQVGLNFFAPKVTLVDLNQQLSAIFQRYPQVTAGVSVINLKSGKQDTFGSTAPITAASTTKVLTAADFLAQVEAGHYSLSDPLGDETAGWQLQQLINQSNDDSWNLFINLLGGAQLQTYAQQIGLSSYNFNANTITPADDAVMLQKLYQGKLLNPSDTQLLLSYMQNTNDEQLIPAALPAGATVHHKYGELLESSGNYVHDTAIITNQGHSFVLSIYTNRPDLLDYPNRVTMIHQITQAIVNYES